MATKTHREKVKIARTLMSRKELREGVGVFSTSGWISRKIDREARVRRTCEKVAARKFARAQKAKIRVLRDVGLLKV
jgi:hypothetical protein